jgi:Lamin Tail Domain
MRDERYQLLWARHLAVQFACNHRIVLALSGLGVGLQPREKHTMTRMLTMARLSAKAALRSTCLCRVGLALLLLHQSLCVVNGSVVINEIMLNPFDPAHGQWIELYNTGNTAVSLDGWFIRASANGDSIVSVFTFDASHSIAANGYLTVGKNDVSGYVDVTVPNLIVYPVNGATFGGDYCFFFLHANSGVNEDALYWYIFSDFFNLRLPFTSEPGISLSRISSAIKTQDPSNWCLSSTFISANERATPRAINAVDCPFPPTYAPTQTSTVGPTKEPKGKKAPTASSPTKAPKGKKATKNPSQMRRKRP